MDKLATNLHDLRAAEPLLGLDKAPDPPTRCPTGWYMFNGQCVPITQEPPVVEPPNPQPPPPAEFCLRYIPPGPGQPPEVVSGPCEENPFPPSGKPNVTPPNLVSPPPAPGPSQCMPWELWDQVRQRCVPRDLSGQQGPFGLTGGLPPVLAPGTVSEAKQTSFNPMIVIGVLAAAGIGVYLLLRKHEGSPT